MTTTGTINPKRILQKDCRCFDSDDVGAFRNRPSWLQRSSRKRLTQWLEELDGGSVRFADLWGERVYGKPAEVALRADWTIANPRFYDHLATDGSLGVAESYLRGHWRTSNLTTLMRLFCRNIERTEQADAGLAAVAKIVRRATARRTSNTRAGSRRNIAAHYDLSNDFFELFLDETMMYSSAFFETPDASLEEASTAKLERICDKLDLRPTDDVVEIGTGWGGFALHAAGKYGCSLTTTTISAAQFEKARDRIAAADLNDRVRLLDKDYRDLRGQFDKLVSIEMVEAVGERRLDAYFRQCGRLLKPGGRCVIQAIVMPEERYPAYRRSVDFIQKYIFPGGFLPSVAAIQESVGRTSNLRLRWLDDISPHYALTLNHWRRRFFSHIGKVRALGFDDRFIRMWEYYLCCCEAAFLEQTVRVVQIAWDKPK